MKRVGKGEYMARDIISLSDIAQLKQQAKERFSAEIHVHDSCGGQSFSTDGDNEALRVFIGEFFAARGIKIKFTVDGQSFYTV